MSETPESDGLDSFSVEQLGQKTGAFGGARLLKYVTDHFVTREGEIIEPIREMIVLGLKKIVQKFVSQKLVDTIVVPDGESMPNVDAMNEEAPREEWGTDLNGNPVGPFMRVLVLKMLDASSMERFAFVTSSVGGSIAIGDLSDKVKVMRRLNGPNVAPVVSCCVTNFKTRYAMRKRPDFRVLRWIALGGDGSGGLPKPESAKSLAAPTSKGKTLGIGTPVASPRLSKKWTGTRSPSDENQEESGCEGAHPFSPRDQPCANSLSISKPVARSTSPRLAPISMPATQRPTFVASRIA